MTLIFDLDLFAWTSLLSIVMTRENFMMIQWQEHSSEKGVTDGRADIHRTAWSQLKIKKKWFPDFVRTQNVIIAQVYRLSAVHCQMTRYSQGVPGYLTRYSVSANEISFDKKISQWDCVFQIRLGLEENDSLSTWWLQQAFWRPNWRIIQNMTLTYVLSF